MRTETATAARPRAGKRQIKIKAEPEQPVTTLTPSREQRFRIVMENVMTRHDSTFRRLATM